MNSYFQILTIAKKEFGDALKNKVFLTFLLFLIFLTGVSIIVASADFQNKVMAYKIAILQLQQSGQVVESLTAPQFFPLQLLRGTIEYFEIIGAVLAIVLGYLSIAREKGNNTLQLLLTRPIKRITFFVGKLLGNVFLLTTVSAIIFLGIYLVLLVIGKTTLTSTETIKFFLSFLFSIIYLLTFFSISVILSLVCRSLPNALIISFVIWILFVLVVPQIGDTMDPDNQVPGGLFASIHMNKPDSLTILAQFSKYEHTRDALEQSSLTKHYERLDFALLGIKDTYNEKPLSFIFKDRKADVWWLSLSMIITWLLSALIFIKKQTIWRED